MSDQKTHITKGVVSSLETTGTRYEIWDTAVSGFGIRVNKGGSKTYVYLYRHRQRPRRYTIGSTIAWTPDEARREAKKLAGLVAKGGDPAADKIDERHADAAPVTDTMDDLLDRYEDKHIPTLKPKTQDDYSRWIRLYIRPHFCAQSTFPTRVDDVTRGSVEALRDSLLTKPRTCKLVIDLTRAIFEKADIWGLRSKLLGNPARGVDKPKGKKRRVYLEPTEIHIVLDALDSAHTRGPAEVHALDILRMQIFTGARRDEIRLLTWGEVQKNRIIKDEHKTDSQGSEDFVREIFLTEPAAEIINSIHSDDVSDDAYVFTGKNAFSPVGKTTHYKIWQSALAIARENGLKKNDLRPHDLRHSFASVAARHGVAQDVVGDLLGHRDGQTTKRYTHIYDDAKKEGITAITAALKRK